MSATDVLAVDPGVNSPGAAIVVGGRLVAASRVVVPTGYAKIDRGQRHLLVADMIVDWARPRARFAGAFVVAFEWPQAYYDEGRDKVDKNDLIGLAGIGMAVAGRVAIHTVSSPCVLAPTPAEWTGQIPKSTRGDPWASPRGERLRSRLDAAELAAVEAQHDAIDAACIALWAVGRWERRRAFHR